MNPNKNKLIYLLQNAYSGERAAAYAYKGHGASVTNPNEIADLKKIEMEEWEHRQCIGIMLAELGSGPRTGREFIMSIVGKVISTLCLCGRYLNFFNFGWFMSMYGAGKLERGNIVEYEIAAEFAQNCGYEHFVEKLLEMAEVEWDHELYFRKKSLESDWSKYISVWPEPSSRNQIKENFYKINQSKAEILA